MKNLASSSTRNPLKKPSYAQASKGDIDEIIRIKKAFLKLLANKVSEIHKYYNLKLKELSNRTTLVLSNTRELDRVPSTK